MHRGIFVKIRENKKCWISFKFENLPTFCFGCGRLRHGSSECQIISLQEKEKIVEERSYFAALRAESPLFKRESLKFGFSTKKLM